jgi:hypothetical protein
MRELDDTQLEVQLRRVLAERLDTLPLDLTVDDLEDRRTERQRRRARRRPWLILGLAAVLLLPVGWLAAGAPLPRPTVPTVALETTTSDEPASTLTPAPTAAVSTSPALAGSSDGTIAYSIQDLPNRPYNHAHLMNADGTGDREIGQGSCPIFSNDGRSLSYWSGWAETRQLVIADADGSSPQFLPAFGPLGYRGAVPEEVLSPDFSHVAWFKRLGPMGTGGPPNEVWVSPVSGGPAILVAPKSANPNERYSSAVWSPDGRRIAFAGFTEVTNGDNSGMYRSAIYVVNADGSDLRRLTARSGDDSSTFSWSPDGHYIAYDGSPDGVPPPSLGASPDPSDSFNPPPDSFYPPPDIFIIGSDGTRDRNITTTPTAERMAKWSPDGSHLAFWGATVPGESGSRVATVRMAGGSAVGSPVLSPLANDYVWSPDGTRLLLLGSPAGRSSIVAVEPKSEQPLTTLRNSTGYEIFCASWQRLEP